MRKKPSVKTACVANRYAGPGERIVEFHGTKFGGLISFRETQGGTLIVEVYRADKGVIVCANGKELRADDFGILEGGAS